MINMKVAIVTVAGQVEALLGMGLSHGLVDFADVARYRTHGIDLHVLQKLYKRAALLAGKDGGHNKFLESIVAWVVIKAPRYWWQEMDTYRHLSKQSESTMHTIAKGELTQEDFVEIINWEILAKLNEYIKLYPQGDEHWKLHYLRLIKAALPEGFLQTRLVRLDMMSMRNIYRQRRNHKLEEWQIFIEEMRVGLGNELWPWIIAGVEKEKA